MADSRSFVFPADAFVAIADTDIAFIHSGSLRKDLPAGDVRLVIFHANFHKYARFDA